MLSPPAAKHPVHSQCLYNKTSTLLNLQNPTGPSTRLPPWTSSTFTLVLFRTHNSHRARAVADHPDQQSAQPTSPPTTLSLYHFIFLWQLSLVMVPPSFFYCLSSPTRMNTLTTRTLSDLLTSVCIAPAMVLGILLNELTNFKKWMNTIYSYVKFIPEKYWFYY